MLLCWLVGLALSEPTVSFEKVPIKCRPTDVAVQNVFGMREVSPGAATLLMGSRSFVPSMIPYVVVDLHWSDDGTGVARVDELRFRRRRENEDLLPRRPRR